MQNFKLVVVGDGAVGKSCLLIASQTGSFPGEYVPTVFDNYCANVLVDDRAYSVGLWDTAGQEDYDRLRPLSYPQTDAFLFCFDVTNRNSFLNIEEKWIPEVRHHAPDSAVILVATKIDLRSNISESIGSPRSNVTYEEGKQLANKLGISTYLECSALTHAGIDAVIPTAVRTAVRENPLPGKTSFWFLGKRIFSRKNASELSKEPQPPVMPPAGPAPRIDVITATFADDWRNVLHSQDSSCTDVKFIVAPHNLVIHAHKIILASSSVIFKEIFLSPKISNQVPQKYAHLFEEIKWIPNDQSKSGLNNLNLPPSSIDKTRDNDESVKIALNPSISYDMFIKILEFLYTGQPGFSEIENEDFIQEIKQTAKLFRLDWLTQVCENRLKDEEFLNPSIGTWLNDDMGSNTKRLFFNKPTMSDVQFRVEGKLVYAHKAVLMARCDVMAAMLGGAFMETNTRETEIKDAKPDSFLAILEYLYTDHAPIEEGDAIDIMVLADRFCLPRLVTLCELYITKKIDKMIEKKVGDSVEYVVNLLLLSQAHNAVLLSNWCLHFIATNYSVFETSPLFSLIQGTNKEYIEENRWPPLSYFNDLQEYEKKIGNTESKDKCIVM